MTKKSTSDFSSKVAEVKSMVTRCLPILKSGTDAAYPAYALEKSTRYTYAFHSLYKTKDVEKDKDFIKAFEERFYMCDVEYRSCVSEVNALISSMNALNNKKLEDILALEEEYIEAEGDSEERFKLFNKIASLRRQLNHSAVFGGRQLMRSLNKASNRILKEKTEVPKIQKEIDSYEKELNDDNTSKRDKKRLKYKITLKKQAINRIKELAEKAKERLPKIKEELKEKRILDCSLMGEANQNGNRFVDFDLNNGKLTIKITGDEKYKVRVKIPYNFKNEIKKLQELIDRKEISVTVKLSPDEIKLQYDLAILNGFNVDEKSRRAEVKEVKKFEFPKEFEEKKIKEIYKKYYDEQKDRMLVNKIEGRCICVDLNPGDIGYAVLQIDDSREEGYRIIAAGRFAWTSLMAKTGKSSSSSKSKKRNNKRKNAICLVIKMLFKIALHYKCSEFIMEDLDFKDKEKKPTESNRKCKNVWHKELTEKLINKRSVENGMFLVKTNPCLTSFMGNVKHPFSDSVNAAIEIGRRGLLRYKGGAFYPQMTMRDRNTMAEIADDGDKGDASGFTYESWKKAYKSVKACYKKKSDFEHRYRTSLKETSEKFLKVRDRYYNSGI